MLPSGRIPDIVATVLELVGDLDAHEDEEVAGESGDAPVALPQREASLPRRPVAGPDLEGDAGSVWTAEAPVLCVAGRGPLDDAAAAILVQLLGKHGIGARRSPHAAVARGRVAELDGSAIAMVCLCYVEISGNPTHLRYLLRRLRQQIPGAEFLVGLWPAGEAVLHDARLREALGADQTTGSLTDTVNACLRIARRRPAVSEVERLSA